MSTWNIERKIRTEIIEVKEILQKWDKHSVGLPAMEIFDQKGRKHLLTAVDFLSFEWEKIKEGSKLKLTLGESIVNARVLE